MKLSQNPTQGRVLLVTVVLMAVMVTMALAGQPGLKVFFSSDFTDRAYQQKSFDKVSKAWKMPSEAPEPGSKTVVVVTIMKDGNIAEARIHHESGSVAWDEASLGTIKGLKSFDPLPKAYPRPTVEAHFHFEWNP